MTIEDPAGDAGFAPELRYIRLGARGSWFEDAIRDNVLLFGDNPVPHELALSGGPDRIAAYLKEEGYHADEAGRVAHEILTFYRLGEDAVWVTYQGDLVWWCRADAKVEPNEGRQSPRVRRRVIGHWSCHGLQGQPLRVRDLPKEAEFTARTRRAVWQPQAHEAIRRLIQGRRAGPNGH